MPCDSYPTPFDKAANFDLSSSCVETAQEIENESSVCSMIGMHNLCARSNSSFSKTQC